MRHFTKRIGLLTIKTNPNIQIKIFYQNCISYKCTNFFSIYFKTLSIIINMILDDEDEHPITELHPDQIAEILDKEAEEKEMEEQNKMQE